MMGHFAKSLALVSMLGLVGCGGDEKPGTPEGGGDSDTQAPDPGSGDGPEGGDGTEVGGGGGEATSSGHGEHLELGTLTLGDFDFQVDMLGTLTPGEEGAFAVDVVKHPDGVEPASLSVYLWVEDKPGAQVSAPVKGGMEDGTLHFHATPKAGSEPYRVVLRLRHGGADERAGLPLSGHGHEHDETPHGGVVAAFQDAGGATVGHLELKLHDDKGDLELWLTKDEEGEQPFDLPLEATLQVTFVDVDGRVVVLRVRNAEQNEGEDGNANVRDTGTNYFIYPGDTGADSTWLMGVEFSSIVTVAFNAGGQAHQSEELMLVPHTHADGEEH